MSISLKNQAFYLKTILALAISNFIAVNPVQAFNVTLTNTGFEDSGDGMNTGGFTGWTTTGDASINSSFQGITPTADNYQALITNSCPTTAETLCSSSGSPVIDDDPRAAGAFNYSGNDQTNASSQDIEKPTLQEFELQSFFGLDNNGLSVPRENGTVTGFRTPKEGSGIKQDITIEISSDDVTKGTNGFTVSFNWAYFTNDGKNDMFGDQDFAFLSLYEPAVTSPDELIVLADSDATLTSPTSDNFVYQDTTYYTANNQFNYSVTGLPAGTYTYTLGFGVVDVDGPDRSSALLLDNLVVQQVPFEFSPSLGLILMAGFFGINYFRRRMSLDRTPTAKAR